LPTTIEILPAEFAAVVGPSGSGKTALLSMLGGMLAPSSSKIWLDGESLDVASASQRARIRQQKLGFVCQTFHLTAYRRCWKTFKLP
jgi:putative ABC transport system ATP-binding protein